MQVVVCDSDPMPTFQTAILYPRDLFGQDSGRYSTDEEEDYWDRMLAERGKYIVKCNYDYDFENARFVPRNSWLKLKGWANLGEGLIEVLNAVQEIYVNFGPPSQEQMARLLGGAMGPTPTAEE
jgi:hypothetical protein